jgi:hypothetical protein
LAKGWHLDRAPTADVASNSVLENRCLLYIVAFLTVQNAAKREVAQTECRYVFISVRIIIGDFTERERTPLLTGVRLNDAVMADVIDALSFERTTEGRRYINYRDLSVQQLGSIYERLLEHEVIRDGGTVAIRPNIFARRASGSYYTHDDLVGLIIRETISPFVVQRMEVFRAANEEQAARNLKINVSGY